MNDDSLTPIAIKKATNLCRDAQQAITVGLIPILGLIFLLRLANWYSLKSRFPALVEDRDDEHAELTVNFRAALHRLWFAVLFWPALVIFIILLAIAIDKFGK